MDKLNTHKAEKSENQQGGLTNQDKQKYIDLYHKLRQQEENGQSPKFDYIDGEDGIDSNIQPRHNESKANNETDDM